MKILVVYATAGAGHKKAAEAVYDALRLRCPETIYADVLAYTNKFYEASYASGYAFLIKHLPTVWALCFAVLNFRWIGPVMAVSRRLFNRINAAAFERYLKAEQFDYIISTHFLPNEVAGYLKRTGQIRSTVIGCVTDFDVHRIWLARGIDQYAVASDYTRDRIVSLGVRPDQVAVTGIPTHEKFSSHPDSGAVRDRLGLSRDRFTVLIAMGSFGFGPIERVVQALMGFQVMVVCGHNQKLYARLHHRAIEGVTVFGLVNNMDELMAAADVMITKPGGLSISEALVAGLPLVFFSAIPGQEENNVRVLACQGVGASGLSIPGIAALLRQYQERPEVFTQAREQARRLGRPGSVKDILALIR